MNRRDFFKNVLVAAAATAGGINIVGSTKAALSAIWLTAFLTTVLHTIMGPDHYLPFIAIGKSRGHSLKKT